MFPFWVVFRNGLPLLSRTDRSRARTPALWCASSAGPRGLLDAQGLRRHATPGRREERSVRQRSFMVGNHQNQERTSPLRRRNLEYCSGVMHCTPYPENEKQLPLSTSVTELHSGSLVGLSRSASGRSPFSMVFPRIRPPALHL